MTTNALKARILLADDDPDFRYQQAQRLQQAGYEVIEADSQKQAEQILASNLPDLALVDVMMETSDAGFALCYHIKKINPAIPVIIVTGVTPETGLEIDASTQEERSWVKADKVLDKPVRFEQLLREIEHLLKATHA